MTSAAALPARELDAAVAREVMGWHHEDGNWHDADGKYAACDDDFDPHVLVWSPSTCGSAMLAVLDALRERGWRPDMRWHDDEDGSGWMAIFWPGEKHEKAGSASADYLPRAVALAALAAVGGK